MNGLTFENLSVPSKLRLCWSFLWRGIATTVASGVSGVLAGMLSGAVAGLIGGLAGVPKPSVLRSAQWIGTVSGVLIGLCFFYIYIRWLLSSRLGRFRLQLVVADSLQEPIHHDPS